MCSAKRAVFQRPQGREQKEGRQHEVRMIETFRTTEQRNKLKAENVGCFSIKNPISTEKCIEIVG